MPFCNDTSVTARRAPKRGDQQPAALKSKFLKIKVIFRRFFFPVTLRPNAGHGLLILEVSWSHTTTHHSRWDSSGRVISSSQRPLPDNTQHSQHTNVHTPGGIWTQNLSRRATVDLRLRPRSYWDRPYFVDITANIFFHDLSLSLKQPLKSADDKHIEVLKIVTNQGSFRWT